MDNIAEQQDVAREISDAISNPVALGGEFDEDDLEKELEELEQEALEEDLVNITPTPIREMPDVPNDKIAQKAKGSEFYMHPRTRIWQNRFHLFVFFFCDISKSTHLDLFQTL